MDGYRKNDVSCVSKRSTSESYSTFEPFSSRIKSVPCATFFASMCSRTRNEKKRSREESKRIPERFSMSALISESSCSVTFGPAMVLSIIKIGFLLFVSRFPCRCSNQNSRNEQQETRNRLSSSCRHLHYVGAAARATTDAELRERFVQLLGEFHHVLDRTRRLSRALRGLASDVGDDLHRVRNTF